MDYVSTSVLPSEIMLCDFSNGLQVVSKLNLTPMRPTRPPQPPPNFTISGLDEGQLMTAVIEAGSWNNHYPGDPRIELDLSRLVSFYDSNLAPSLVPLRHGQQRHEHRLEGIAPVDVKAIRGVISEVLTRKGGGSGINWKGLFRVVTVRFADRLELIQHLLNVTDVPPSREPLDSAKVVQQQLRIMLTPYIINTAVPPPSDHEKSGNHSWTAPVFEYCTTTHTDFITLNPALTSTLTPSELLLLRAVRDTTKEICRVLVKMWAQSVAEGLDPVFNSPTPDISSVENLLDGWRADISGLMDWLDWSVWIKCRPECGLEVCAFLSAIGRLC
ncbi:hypothetical protein DXG03_008015 [Asterophora parasitica]|uniref:Uncharacterized protein n=1 Tax=Asterophora parasitica TaxID=117018 RepID=A0A9P7G6V7_9AGAR|nr:hypothetical protein DXG03_008015 [Asterophora parasitica]